jgi:hypothetical protein
MPRRLVVLLCALGALAAFPAIGQAKPLVGFSEQGASMFTDPLFTSLHNVKIARLIVSYDAVVKHTSEEQTTADWLKGAAADGIEPLVSLNHSRGCFGNCKLPSAAQYTKAFKAFHTRFPQVKDISPWNEANHFSQPTYKSPKAAARFYSIAKANCRGCKIVALDVLDQHTVKRGKKVFLSAEDYTKQFKHFVKGSPTIWGLHNYSDTNRFRNSVTKSYSRLVHGQIWLTETGGVVKLGRGFPYSISRAAKAVSFMFKLASSNSKIKRLYVYQWTGATKGARFDAGVINPDGSPRPAYNIIKQKLG